MLGKLAAQRQLEILKEINIKSTILCDDEITDDHRDLTEIGFIAENETSTYPILLGFFPTEFRITEEGKQFLDNQLSPPQKRMKNGDTYYAAWAKAHKSLSPPK